MAKSNRNRVEKDSNSSSGKSLQEVFRTLPSLHVVPRADKWAVIDEGKSGVSSTFATQTEAIEEARKLAKDQAGELVVHGRNGRIRERDNYARDPFPPKVARKVFYPSAPPRNSTREDIGKAVTQAVRKSGR
jgi:hypothetical protein